MICSSRAMNVVLPNISPIFPNAARAVSGDAGLGGFCLNERYGHLRQDTAPHDEIACLLAGLVPHPLSGRAVGIAVGPCIHEFPAFDFKRCVACGEVAAHLRQRGDSKAQC